MADVGEIKARITLENQAFKKSVDEAKTKMGGLSDTSQNVKRDLDFVQKASLAVGAAVIAGIGASTKVAIDFESAMARVKANF